MTREEALSLLQKWVPNKNLQKHMFAVEAAVKAYARKIGGNEVRWAIAGLLHDADWEKWPNDHPKKIVEHLKTINADKEIIDAIDNHAYRSAKDRTTDLDRCLFACDELTGLIVATALMYPNKLNDVTVERVMKKFKTPGFARGVNRQEVAASAEELGVNLEDHIAFVLEAMRGIKKELGLS